MVTISPKLSNRKALALGWDIRWDSDSASIAFDNPDKSIAMLPMAATAPLKRDNAQVQNAERGNVENRRNIVRPDCRGVRWSSSAAPRSPGSG